MTRSCAIWSSALRERQRARRTGKAREKETEKISRSIKPRNSNRYLYTTERTLGYCSSRCFLGISGSLSGSFPPFSRPSSSTIVLSVPSIREMKAKARPDRPWPPFPDLSCDIYSPSGQTSVSILIAFRLLLWRGLQFNFVLLVTSLVRSNPSSSSIMSDEDSDSELFFRCWPGMRKRQMIKLK